MELFIVCDNNDQCCDSNDAHEKTCECSEGRVPRHLQPFILLALKEGASHGYELIEKIHDFRFNQSPPDAGSTYRALRNMEKDGWVSSQWDTKGTGPAKRIYRITPQGEEILHGWAITIRKRKESFECFLETYRGLYRSESKA